MEGLGTYRGKLSLPLTGPLYCLCALSRGLIPVGWRSVLLPGLPVPAPGWDFTESNKSPHERLPLYQKAEIPGGVACRAAASLLIAKDNVKCLRVCEILAGSE